MSIAQHIWPTRTILGVVLIIFCLLVFRLGVKSVSFTESDIVTHYSDLYLEHESIEGRDASRADCYALALSGLFERLEVICKPPNADPYRYVIGNWGQLLRLQRGLGLHSGQKALRNAT